MASDQMRRLLDAAEKNPLYLAHRIATWLEGHTPDYDAIAGALNISREDFDLVRICQSPKTLKECIEIVEDCVPPEQRATVVAWICHLCDIPVSG